MYKKYFLMGLSFFFGIAFLQSIEKSQESIFELPTPNVATEAYIDGRCYNLYLVRHDGPAITWYVNQGVEMYVVDHKTKTIEQLSQEQSKKIVEIKKDLIKKSIAATQKKLSFLQISETIVLDDEAILAQKESKEHPKSGIVVNFKQASLFHAEIS